MYQDPEISAMSQVYEAFKSLDNIQRNRIIKWVTGRFGLFENMSQPPQQPLEIEVVKPTVQQFVQPGTEPVVVESPAVLMIEKPVGKKIDKKAEKTAEKVEKTTEKKKRKYNKRKITPPAESLNEVPAPQVTGKKGRKKVEKVTELPPKRKRRTRAEIEADLAEKKQPAEIKIQEPVEQDETEIIPLSTPISQYKSIETLFLSSTVATIPSKVLLVAAYLQESEGMKSFSSFEINSRLKKLGYGVSNISSYVRQLMSKKVPLMVQAKKEGKSSAGHGVFKVTNEGLKVAISYLNTK